MVTNLVRHGLISFVAALVLGVAISVATTTHKTLLDSTPILLVVPRRMTKIFGLTFGGVASVNFQMFWK
jgi:hypothetical protein